MVATNEKKTEELQEINVILRIPKDTDSISITARLKDRNCRQTIAKRFFTAKEILTAHQHFSGRSEDCDDYEGLCVLTDKSREFLIKQKKGVHDEHRSTGKPKKYGYVHAI